MENENENKSEQFKKQAEQLKNQAVEMLSKVDAQKAMGMADRFMRGVFKFGKVIAAIFMFLCLVTMALSLVYYVFCGSSGMEVPDFDDVKEQLEQRNSGDGNASDVKEVAEMNAVRKEFESDIFEVMKICNLDKDCFEIYVRKLAGMEKSVREDFMDGLLDFVKDAKKYFEKKGEKFDGAKAVNEYDNLFSEARETAKGGELEAKLKRSGALATCGGALLGLVLFLIIPLLLQIEENTRKA